MENRFAKAKAGKGVLSGGSVSPKQFMSYWVREEAGRRTARKECKCHPQVGPEPVSCLEVTSAPKKVFWTPTPKVTKEVKFPDRNVRADRMLPKNLLLVDATRFRRPQEKFAKSRPPGLSHTGGPKGWWVNKEGLKWVPDEDKDMQLLLYAAAHQSFSGHRGRNATLHRLQKKVFCLVHYEGRCG